MLKYMLITNRPTVAAAAHRCGVQRLFVDLEIHGKASRQRGRQTLISDHRMSDVSVIRAAAPTAELLVRINPLHEGTKIEVEQAIESGADFIMLPMFHTVAQVRDLCTYVRGRAGVVPLIETPAAAACSEELAACREHGVTDVFVGLNDLHIGLGMRFMFEPVANGMMDIMAAHFQGAAMPFGFGGVARVGEGRVSGELVVAEHLRLGSSAVILSRTFHRLEHGSEASALREFELAVAELRAREEILRTRSLEQIESDRVRFREAVSDVVAQVA